MWCSFLPNITRSLNTINKNGIIDLFDYIGYYGPILFIVIVFYFLWNRPKYLLAYLIFFVINGSLNGLLKTLIKQPRPSGQKHNHIDGDIFTNAHIYGMPSGHAQSVGFSAMYLYMTTASTPLLLLSLFMTACTVYQRFKYRRHTMEQLMAGLFVGTALAYFAHYILESKIFSYKNTNKPIKI